MLKQYKDIYASVFLLIVSIIMFIATYSIQKMTVTNIGADFAPRLLAVGIFVLSLILLTNSIKQVRNPQTAVILDEEEEEEEEQNLKESISKLSVVGTIALLIGYVALIPSIGFLIMTAIYLFLQMYLLAERAHRNITLFLIISVVSSGIIYYCFKSIFYLRLPAGILG
ncbi:tripartite tricarboxylate transporter TctB family protein [Halalkalibacter alkalisediminis]|uniref:Tripartite tricarboxylate transporter TctB family protein n=1 Tax=Halalkalibacter alkalisediminis TaxID=935616 RepID=A0ABV6NGZ8_9BACI|nr:tripartite tricarboxylate transporter TctB family protein [Halalkalibacter alkalisediminis]